MAILDLQRRGYQVGRLRIGQQVPTGNKDADGKRKMRPSRLDTFRFTTASRAAAEAIAALYGGSIVDWEGQFEVVTGQSQIGITVPPRDQVVSQWYEMWNKGGALRRCDSQREQISGGPCLCPHAENPDDPGEVAAKALKRADLARLNPPEACKLVTRISVMIPDLPGLGVFRLDTGSYYAAVEIGDAAELMQMARDRGVFLPGILRIEQRSRIAGGQTKKYPVPVLEVLATFRDIVTGAIANGESKVQLPPAPGEPRLAITGGQPAPGAAVPEPRKGGGRARKTRTAQDIADDAANATTREEVEALSGEMKHLEWEQDYVYPDLDPDGVHDELQNILRDKWRKLPAGGAG